MTSVQRQMWQQHQPEHSVHGIGGHADVYDSNPDSTQDVNDQQTYSEAAGLLAPSLFHGSRDDSQAHLPPLRQLSEFPRELFTGLWCRDPSCFHTVC